MRTSARCDRPSRRGAAVVELALLLPLLMFIFVVGGDWCRIFYATHTLDDCARNGALAASGLAYQEHDLSDSERTARAVTQVLKDAANLNPPIEASNVSVVTAGNYVTVTVDYDFDTITSFLVSEWRLTRSSRMPVQP